MAYLSVGATCDNLPLSWGKLSHSMGQVVTSCVTNYVTKQTENSYAYDQIIVFTLKLQCINPNKIEQ